MLVTGDKDRLMVELFFTSEGVLKDVEWANITMSDVSDSDMERLKSIADMLKENRIEKAGKIGRNDPCPCGSGKKYKKCCLQ